MCFWWQRGAHFCKNTRTKCMRPQISSKSLLTNRIFDASSYQDPSVILFFTSLVPRKAPLCSRPTFLRRFLRLHRGGHKAKEKGMIFILIFSNFMKIGSDQVWVRIVSQSYGWRYKLSNTTPYRGIPPIGELPYIGTPAFG